ncbi:metacaspase [Acrasis kona]|uniref:Metacaspase n=1 Tax=Acrasis kona TaxID=1008807 RepID=A0AAW2YSD9_9EUKA
MFNKSLVFVALLVAYAYCTRIEFFGADGKLASTQSEKRELTKYINNNFGMSVEGKSLNEQLDMFERPTSNVIFVVSQAEPQRVIAESLGAIVSKWSNRFGENNVNKLSAVEESNENTYSIPSEYTTLSADKKHVRDFSSQLALHKKSLVQQSLAGPVLSIVTFPALSNFNKEEMQDAQRFFQQDYVPSVLQQMKNGRTLTQVIYQEADATRSTGRKLLNVNNVQAVNDVAASNTTVESDVYVPNDYEIAEWQAGIWTVLIMVFAGIFAVWFIMQIDYSADQMSYAAEMTRGNY